MSSPTKRAPGPSPKPAPPGGRPPRQIPKSNTSADVPNRDTPSADWSVKRLARYASDRLATAKRLGDEAVELGRRSVREFYEAGRALVLIRDKLKPKGEWVAWQRKSGPSRSQVNRAVRLYDAAADPSALLPFAGIGDALDHFGIEAKKPSRPKPRRDGAGKDPVGGSESGEANGGKEGDHSDTSASPDGVLENGDIQIAENAAWVHADLLEQVSATDRARPLLVARSWDRRTKTALRDGMAVLLIPELDDRWQPAGEDRA